MILEQPIGCWINGKPGSAISALDGGLHYGHGLFETMAVKDGRILLEKYHLERLSEGCKRFRLRLPSHVVLERELGAASEGAKRLLLKLIVTRGVSRPSHNSLSLGESTRILLAYPWRDYPAAWYEHGIRVHICETHISRNSRLAGLKHLGRMEQVLARDEWTEADDIQEGLMVDEEGSVVQGTETNVFAWLPHGVLATPILRLSGVAGVMRRYILEQAEKTGVQVRIATLSLPELMGANEIFVCNSIVGVWPVTSIGHWKYTIGPVTRQVQDWVTKRP